MLHKFWKTHFCNTKNKKWMRESIEVFNVDPTQLISQSLTFIWCGPSEIYFHRRWLLFILLDKSSYFLLRLYILCSSTSEFITPLFMFILTLSLVKVIFVVWVSVRSPCCFVFYCINFVLNCDGNQICHLFLLPQP